VLISLSAADQRADYPMTSALSAEHNLLHSRAKLVLAVFSSIGLGSFTAAIVYVILLVAFKSSINDSTYHLQWVWRLLFGIGLIPLSITLYFRLTMPESKPYVKCGYHLPPRGLSLITSRCRRGDLAQEGWQAWPARAIPGFPRVLLRVEARKGPLCCLHVLVSFVSAVRLTYDYP
jgi:MFS family permease